MNKKRLCEAFCGEVEVRPVPAGYAVTTPFEMADGDFVGFHVMKTAHDGMYRLADSGLAVPFLEAAGVDLDQGTRAEAFERLLAEYSATLDPHTLEIRTSTLREDELPAAALRFVSLLLRVQDLELLKPETVESTFREDAARAIEEQFGAKAKLERDAALSLASSTYVVDMLITPFNGPRPTAVYFASSENRVSEAVMLHMEARLANEFIPIVLLLETPKPKVLSERALGRAMNHLAVAAFRGFEGAAMDKIATAAGIGQPRAH